MIDEKVLDIVKKIGFIDDGSDDEYIRLHYNNYNFRIWIHDDVDLFKYKYKLFTPDLKTEVSYDDTEKILIALKNIFYRELRKVKINELLND